MEHQHAVLVEPPAQAPLPVPAQHGLGVVQPVGAAVAADDLLDLGGGGRLRVAEEEALVVGGGDAGDGADLGVADRAFGEGLPE
jgi:hypothetical protein